MTRERKNYGGDIRDLFKEEPELRRGPVLRDILPPAQGTAVLRHGGVQGRQVLRQYAQGQDKGCLRAGKPEEPRGRVRDRDRQYLAPAREHIQQEYRIPARV